MNKTVYTHTIAQDFICAIEYGDSTHNDETDKLVQDFVDQYPWGTFDYSDTVNFDRCEITGLMSDCITCTVTIFPRPSFGVA